jgi:hypothetical protein
MRGITHKTIIIRNIYRIGHVLCRNCLLKYIKCEIKGRIKVTRREGRSSYWI